MRLSRLLYKRESLKSNQCYKRPPAQVRTNIQASRLISSALFCQIKRSIKFYSKRTNQVSKFSSTAAAGANSHGHTIGIKRPTKIKRQTSAQLAIQNSIQDTSTQEPCSIKASVRSTPFKTNSRQTRNKYSKSPSQAHTTIAQTLHPRSAKNSQSDSFGTRYGSETQARDRTTSSQEPHSVEPIHLSGTSNASVISVIIKHLSTDSVS